MPHARNLRMSPMEVIICQRFSTTGLRAITMPRLRGTYLRLRTLQLGYNFPDNLLGFFKKARVYLEFDNLFTITPYSGYSPDVNANSVYQRGFDEFIYPSNRTYMFGINLTF